MDSTLTKPMPAKSLGELLQEQQEPFSLDAYLVERGYLRKTLDSRLTSVPRKRSPPFPKILKTVLKKIVSVKTASSCEEPAVRFTSASSMTVYDSESDMEEEFPSHQQNHISLSCSDPTQTSKFCYFKEQVTVTDRTQECGCLEESKQHSPVSVLEELHSDEGSPFYNHNKTIRCFPRSIKLEIPSTFTNRLTEESLLSASLWDLLQHTPFEKQDSTGVRELRELLGPSSSSSQYRKTKRALEQTKQLLFDSAREVMEKQGRNENKLLGPEQMGKIICEQICFWSNQSGNLTNLTKMLSSDILEPTEKWSDTLPQTREIEMQISNAILEEMEFEIVSDLIACNIR